MDSNEPSYYIMVASPVRTPEGRIPSDEAVSERLRRGYWALPERTAYREKLRAGDKVLFYAGGSGKSWIVGSAILKSGSQTTAYRERQKLEPEFDFVFLGTEYGVHLEKVVHFEKPVALKSLLGQLQFVRNPDRWGAYLRGGVIKISETDYLTIVKAGGSA